MLWTYQYFSFKSVHGEATLKMGWVVKKWMFSFWKAINWSKCILMVSVYIWLSIYTNNAILCIIWKFDLSSRGVLGRIYALSIEVLIILFPADTFSKKQLIFRPHYKRNEYKLLGKKTIMQRVLHQPAPDTVNLVLKKKKLHLVLKKKNCWGRIPGFHLSDKKKVYLWTLDHGGGVGGGTQTFLW